jgi:K+-transporting ATPase ATPase C chain
MRLPAWLSQHLAALRTLLVLTVICGLIYPFAILAAAQLPGLRSRADGSLLKVDGTVVGSRLIGQGFVDKDGQPLVRYFQSRPSAAGKGWDPTATAASNLGPESVVDRPGKPSLLTQVCSRSLAVGRLEGVDGARPYCTADGVGAVLGVFPTRVVSLNQTCPATPFITVYKAMPVECARPGEDSSTAVIVPIRGDAPADPAVPPDAVTASASGLDPQISPAYARLQAPRVAKARNLTVDQVMSLVDKYTTGRALGFMGEPGVNVLELNVALDQLS